MSVTFHLKDTYVYFDEAATVSGVSYSRGKWYPGVSGDCVLSAVTKLYFANEDGTYLTYNSNATDLSDLSPSQYVCYNTSGTKIGGSAVATTISGVKCKMLTTGSTAIVYIYGTSASVSTTTIDCSGISVDGSAFSGKLFWGTSVNSLAEATKSGNSYSFTTPDGGGDVYLRFTNSDQTKVYEFTYLTTDTGENVPYDSTNKVYTVSLDDGDNSYTLLGNYDTPVVDKIELDLYSLTINGDEYAIYTDLVIGYHFDTGSEVKLNFNSSISVSYNRGYETFYLVFYDKDGNAYDMSNLSVTTGSYSTNWQISENVITATLVNDTNYGDFEGDLKTAGGQTGTLTIVEMDDPNGNSFVETYSGAVLTYKPVNGAQYSTGDSVTLQVVVSGGWKFDTTAACQFGQRYGSGNPAYSEVTYVDEHTATGTFLATATEGKAWFTGMVGLKDEEPEPDYATFITPYIVSKANVQAIASRIWVNSDGSTITATDNILSYKEIYDTLTSDKSQEIKLGGYATGSTAPYLVDYTHRRNLGSVDIEEHWHNADDYNNTTVRVYVPLVGLVDVETSQVMGHKLYLEYRYEVIDGKALAVLYTDSYSPDSIIWQGSANFAIDEPITSNTSDSYANSYWTILSAQMGDLTPYVLIDRKQPAEGLSDYVGNKVQIVKQVKECAGYVEFEEITVNGLECTNAEYAEIASLLNSGVIV